LKKGDQGGFIIIKSSLTLLFQRREYEAYMYIFNLVQQILSEMWQRKLRSALALFGIIWGTLTVVLLLAIGHGFTQASQKNIMQIADGVFFAFPAKTTLSYRGYPAGQKINLKAKTVMQLKKAIPDIQAVSPMLSTSVNLSFKGKKVNKNIHGVAPSFGYLRKINLTKQSRFLNIIDMQKKNRVVVLGDKLKTRLMGDIPSLGKRIFIKNIAFTIIGVTQESKKNVYNWYENKALIPYTTYITLFGNKNVHRFIVLPNPDANPQQIAQSMRHYIAWKQHFNPDDESALHVFDTTKIFQFFKWFFVGIQLFLGACGALTLAVGSLGVTNIMFLIVRERTREIGLRMAVGARNWHILLQILFEALVIVALGGFIGFMIAFFQVLVNHFLQS